MEFVQALVRNLLTWVYIGLIWTVANWRTTIPGFIGAYIGWRIADFFRQPPTITDQMFINLGVPPGILNLVVSAVAAGIAISIVNEKFPPQPPSENE